jgi:hypothetical protein
MACRSSAGELREGLESDRHVLAAFTDACWQMSELATCESKRHGTARAHRRPSACVPSARRGTRVRGAIPLKTIPRTRSRPGRIPISVEIVAAMNEEVDETQIYQLEERVRMIGNAHRGPYTQRPCNTWG